MIGTCWAPIGTESVNAASVARARTIRRAVCIGVSGKNEFMVNLRSV